MAELLPQCAIHRALVVDDDGYINLLLRTRLGARGIAASGESSGEAALAYLKNSEVDLIFLDVSMPGIDGLQVLDEVRRRNLDVAVVMTTAFGSEKIAIEAMRRGADDYLRKPFESAEFRVVVDRAIERLSLLRQNRALREQLAEEHRQLQDELAKAGQVQQSLLPGVSLAGLHFDLAARCVPARVVGGDFYDWQILASEVLVLTLGDVMGKGMPAAIQMASVRAALRAATDQQSVLGAVQSVANALAADLDRSDSYITLFCAEFDLATSRLTYVDAGHGHALVCRNGGDTERLTTGGVPVGLLHPFEYSSRTTDLSPGDVLVVYSDGLVDSLPAWQSTKEAIGQVLCGIPTAAAGVERLLELTRGADHAADDVTVVVLQCQ